MNKVLMMVIILISINIIAQNKNSVDIIKKPSNFISDDEAQGFNFRLKNLKKEKNSPYEKSLNFRLDSAVKDNDMTTNYFLYDSLNNLSFSSTIYFSQKDLDTIIYSSKEEKYYDSSGNILLIETSFYDTLINDFITDRKNYYSYLELNGNLFITDSVYIWNNLNWDLTRIVNYQYDENNNLLFYSRFYDYHSNDSLTLVEKNNYGYDQNDLLKFSIRYDTGQNVFYRSEYYYDLNNYFILSTVQKSSDTSDINNWEYTAKREIDRSDTVDVDVFYSWNNTILEWEPSQEQKYYYDLNGNVIKYTRFLNYNSFTEKWESKIKTEQEFYNDSILIAQYNYIAYDTLINEWIGGAGYSLVYDYYYNITIKTNKKWNSSLRNWESYFKDEYIYDSNLILNNLIYPEDLWSTFVGIPNTKLIENNEYFWDSLSNDWKFTRTWKLYYSAFYKLDPLTLHEKKLADIKIFPNPTNDIINIVNANQQSKSGFSIKIISLDGQIIYNEFFKSDKAQIPMNRIASKGIYFVQILDSNKNIIDIQKIVLE